MPVLLSASNNKNGASLALQHGAMWTDLLDAWFTSLPKDGTLQDERCGWLREDAPTNHTKIGTSRGSRRLFLVRGQLNTARFTPYIKVFLQWVRPSVLSDSQHCTYTVRIVEKSMVFPKRWVEWVGKLYYSFSR